MRVGCDEEGSVSSLHIRAPRPTRALAATIVVAAGALLFPSTGRPAFPGANGPIAFVSNRDGNQEIYTIRPDGSDPHRLTANAVADTDPAVSPDGGRIAFTRGLDIWVMKSDGSGQAAVTGTEGTDSAPAWSPDGSKLVFVSNRNTPGGGTTGPELWVMNADGSPVRQLTDTTPGASLAPAWAPVGHRAGCAHAVAAGPSWFHGGPAVARRASESS
jgi:dipeptidyl aminopeptidase/acylaminoacyl peptidase